MATPAAPRRRYIPQFGTIEGGPLNGWSFALLKVGYSDGKKFIDLKVTQPGWVFGKDVRFTKMSFRKLKPGFRAKRHDVGLLFDAALAATGQQK
jgi:hypothetical protein